MILYSLHLLNGVSKTKGQLSNELFGASAIINDNFEMYKQFRIKKTIPLACGFDIPMTVKSQQQQTVQRKLMKMIIMLYRHMRQNKANIHNHHINSQ